MNERLRSLSAEFGQSPWIDNLRRADLQSGAFGALVARGVRGVTSNPAIFEKAFANSTEYDTQFAQLFERGESVEQTFWTVAYSDVAAACDLLREVYEQSNGMDGYVSLEVSPAVANDAPATTAAARAIHEAVAKPNLMVKIPATAACLESIETMIGEGRNINITLIFGLERYDQVIDAYLKGLETHADAGVRDLSSVASVASFFVSRVDKEVDKRLETLGTPEALGLRGRAAVAQAILAYQLARERFSGPRWDKLVALGARIQRPLWASTSVKNPAYPDTLYVDSLIGPDTINTMPEPTLEAFCAHGTLARTIDQADAVAEARQVWTALAAVGIDMADVARILEDEAIASFSKSFEDLLSALQARSAEFSDPER